MATMLDRTILGATFFLPYYRSRQRVSVSPLLSEALFVSRRALVLFSALSCYLQAAGAQTLPPPQLSPDAAYDQVLKPVEITHRSIENWSDIETAALAVAIKQAQSACSTRPPKQFTGEDLIGLARLCTLGQQWPAVLDAATLYLQTPSAATPSSPWATRALAHQIDASLHLDQPATALTAAHRLLQTRPYTDVSQQSTDELLHYLQLTQTADAIDLATERQPLILAQLRNAVPVSPSTASPSTLTPHDLYTAALALPMLQQLNNQPSAASSSVALLESTLPSGLPTDEAILMAQSRRQYALLGTPLPHVPARRSLLGVNETPRINTRFWSATVLLLFPDWCAQCIRMAHQLMPTLVRHAGENMHLYGLLSESTTPVAPPSKPPASARRRSSGEPGSSPNSSSGSANGKPASAAELLQGTPTLVVASDVAETLFAATDFPLLVVTDHNGIIRFVQVAPENAFAAGSLVDQIATRVADLWPPSPAPPRPSQDPLRDPGTGVNTPNPRQH